MVVEFEQSVAPVPWCFVQAKRRCGVVIPRLRCFVLGPEVHVTNEAPQTPQRTSPERIEAARRPLPSTPAASNALSPLRAAKRVWTFAHVSSSTRASWAPSLTAHSAGASFVLRRLTSSPTRTLRSAVRA